MVLGLGLKKKGATVKVEFQIQLQEIKPWRVDAASGSNVPLLVQWQRGDNRSGKTGSVVAKPEDGGKLVFNDTIRLPAQLVREAGKGRNAGVAKFQKKTVVFILQEAKTDLQLARCVMDLAEYGDLQSSVPVSIPLAVGKKNASGGPAPSLFLTIGPLEKVEKTLASKVSFGTSTPRSSISSAPDKTVSASGKSRVEPALDEETRRSIVAALMSDDEDNISIESFTDDEGTPPEDSAPRSGKSPASPTPQPEFSKTATTPPRPEVAKPNTSIPETIPKSSNKSSSSSSSSSTQAVVKTPTEGPTNNTSHDRPIPTKHGPGKAMQSPPASRASDQTVERYRHVQGMQSPGRPVDSSTISAQEFPRSSPPAPASTASITKLFSSEPVYKSSKVEEDFAPEAATRSAKILSNNPSPSAESESQSSKGIRRPPLAEQRDEGSTPSKANKSPVSSSERPPLAEQRDEGSTPSKASKSPVSSSERPPLAEQRDEGPRAKLASGTSSNSGSSPNKANKSPVSSSERPLIVDSNSIDRAGSSGSFAESKMQKPGENAATERPHLPVSDATATKELSKETAAPVSSVQGKVAAAVAAAAAAASAYGASRQYRSIEGSSFDYMSENSEDSLSESSTGGRSPAKAPLRNQSHVSGQPALSPETPPVDAKRGKNNEVESRIGSNMSVLRDAKRDESKIPRAKSPDVKTDIGGEPEKKRDPFDKHEELVEQEGESVLGSARANLAKMEKKGLEELRTKVANAEAKLLAESQKVDKLQAELRDLGAMEVSLYCVVAEHGSSSHKLHTPARRLARLYMYAHKNWSPEKRAGTVKNSVSGLVTVAKSCGSDVSRLSFWWSNVVALRTVIAQAFDKESSSVAKGDTAQANPVGSANGNGSLGWARARRSVSGSSFSSFARRASSQSTPSTPKSPTADWKEASAYIATLETIEEWIYAKIVESLWWQAMIPRMQKDVDASTPTSPKGMTMISPSALFGSAKEDLNKLAGDVSGIFVRKTSRRSVSLPELGDARQGNMCVEVWKKAIMEALRRLCPVRGAGHDCGCLPMLIKMAIEGCVARLDVALFNAILREPDDDVPTDPFSDPVSDSSVLPISPGGLTFGGGSQLKNVVVTWSTFIAGLVNVKEPVFGPDSENGDNADTSEDSDQVPRFFNLIKATGDLLMLPKDILMDKGIRKEEARPEVETNPNVFVMLRTTGDILQLPKDLLMDKALKREICPMLSPELIRRILVNFVPDEFAPDPISPSLLAALNAEASLEKQRHGEADLISSSNAMAPAPSVIYVAPSVKIVWPWIGEANEDPSGWGRNNSSLLRKGYTSDEDLSVMEQLQKSSENNKLDFLMGTSMQGAVNGKHPSEGLTPKGSGSAGGINGGSRFELLEEVWGTP